MTNKIRNTQHQHAPFYNADNGQGFKIWIRQSEDQYHEVFFFTVPQLKHYHSLQLSRGIFNIKCFYWNGSKWERFHLYNGVILTRKKLEELLLTLSA